MAFIFGTSTALPSNCYSQEVLATALKKYLIAEDLDFDLNIIDRFFTNVKINTRYFTLPLDNFYNPPGMEVTVNESLRITIALLEKAIRNLLERASLDPQEISQFTSVTIYQPSPSVEALLMNLIPFPAHLKRVPLGGLGCIGGCIGVARVADYLKGHPTEAVILTTSELNSGLWQGSIQADMSSLIRQLPTDPSVYSDIIMTIVTAALFADGPAATLMVGDEHPLAQPGLPRVVDTRSTLIPNTKELMGLDLVGTGFRNILRPQVSDFVKIGLRQAIEPLLTKYNLSIDQISRWIVHPGGPKILEAVQDEFGLDKEKLRLSHQALEEVGNISSSTVIYILEKVFSEDQPTAGSYGLLVGMGPGFSQEAILLQW
ncbi:type III polyketide synthase [Gloeocapsa sp. PCC 73106]|uniref:type III polyketide synthase n=1 Tax=Gloeocapsa sp. PCC 73106 TaxID=102232 RepID=UPI0002ACC5DB|nr:3-oxoacyl-[acyl-carrier-protein] synthase III C-terminal domain-containing protein [Gloeocapsa sp. PCC 73106]ELR99280.1 putative naringenin-chalcone synthase [Gloeocapsa sp. PCC 73106]